MSLGFSRMTGTSTHSPSMRFLSVARMSELNLSRASSMTSRALSSISACRSAIRAA